MIFIKSKTFFNVLFRKGIIGLAIFPFIVYKHSDLRHDLPFVQHEQIHIRQQIEMLIFPFFIWYGIEFIIRLIQYKGNGNLAYRNISFEREAYQQECEDGYLQRRRFWSFLKYI